MDVNKNSYTFLFASLMVLVVALLLSVSYVQLKPFQDRNIELEKKQNILSSVGINILREEAEDTYDKYIIEEVVVDNQGEKVLGYSAFDIDLAKEIKKSSEDQLLPLFVSEMNDKKQYIIPLRGKGLWGPIWGFISLESDLNRVFGAVFDHKAETPGLGAEINQDFFQLPFKGKEIFKDNTLMSIKVVKGGASKDDLYSVDGISGGTITSDGVTDMLYERLSMYSAYLNKMKKSNEVESMILELDSLDIISDSIIN